MRKKSFKRVVKEKDPNFIKDLLAPMVNFRPDYQKMAREAWIAKPLKKKRGVK